MDRLVFRTRGFKNIYPKDMPLEPLERLLTRRPFASSLSALSFTTEEVELASLKGPLKLSSPALVRSLETSRLANEGRMQ